MDTFDFLLNLLFFGYGREKSKNSNFCKFANFFEDSKSRAQELSNDVSFVIFGHKTWDSEGRSN